MFKHIPDMEGAPLKMNALILEHPFGSQHELLNRIFLHYKKQLFIQVSYYYYFCYNCQNF